MRIWHYTVGARLRSILADGMIKPATEGVSAGERPVTWLTMSPRWEPTANKGIIQDGRIVSLGKTDTAAHGEGLYRIEVAPDAAPCGWEEYKRRSNIHETTAKKLARSGRQVGSDYRDWRVSFEPIGTDKWIQIETETGNDERWTVLSTETVKAWTRPIFDKGCSICSQMEILRSAQWRYTPDPSTGEPRAMCNLCYVSIKNPSRHDLEGVG